MLQIQEQHINNHLHIAQAVTVASMIEAKTQDVNLYCTKHRDEQIEVPQEFNQTADLRRYSYDIGDLPFTKTFPLIGDIIHNLYEASDSEYFIYTNVDIGVFPNFYTKVREFIDKGHDAFCINRRDNMPKKVNGEIINESNYETLFNFKGEKHEGVDCFVFCREYVPLMNFGNVSIGVPPIGKVFKHQLSKVSNKFKVFKNVRLTFHIGNDRVWQNDNIFWEVNKKRAKGLW